MKSPGRLLLPIAVLFAAILAGSSPAYATSYEAHSSQWGGTDWCAVVTFNNNGDNFTAWDGCADGQGVYLTWSYAGSTYEHVEKCSARYGQICYWNRDLLENKYIYMTVAQYNSSGIYYWGPTVRAYTG